MGERASRCEAGRRNALLDNEGSPLDGLHGGGSSPQDASRLIPCVPFGHTMMMVMSSEEGFYMRCQLIVFEIPLI